MALCTVAGYVAVPFLFLRGVIAALLVGVLVPLIGFAVSAYTGRLGIRWALAILLLLAAILAGLIGRTEARHISPSTPTRQPLPSDYCPQYSGEPATCPGC